MSMETGGSLRDGKMIWGLAKVKESFDVGKNDQVDSYLLFENPMSMVSLLILDLLQSEWYVIIL